MAAYTTIDDPEAYFQVKTWTGDGEASLALTLDGDTNMQPDLVWIKARDAAESHPVFDVIGTFFLDRFGNCCIFKSLKYAK